MPSGPLNPPATGPIAGLHGQVLERLGSEIADGRLAAGTIVQLEELEERCGVSRSVVREAVRVLASMGLVTMRRRVGVQVLPDTEWNVYDPQVVRWRLETSGRLAQIQSLTELRIAVEPEAARLAATRAPQERSAEILALAGELWAAGNDTDTERFLALDIEFHRLILLASANEMFSALHPLIAEGLAGRTHHGLMPERPHAEALQLHLDVAVAIQNSKADEAHDAMRAIMTRAMTEVSELSRPAERV